MKYYYSPSQDSFFVDEFKSVYVKNGTWPSDCVNISYETFSEFSLQTPPAGKRRKFVDGSLVWIINSATPESLISDERIWRDESLRRADVELYKVQDGDQKAVGSVSQWREYRKALRVWPEQVDFPNKEFRPKAPDFKE